MIKDVTNSFKATLYQRVNSPLYGTYLFSWVLYNWAIIIPLLLGDKAFDDRLDIFKTNILTPEGEFNNLIILMPLFISGVILLLQPFFQRYLFIYAEWNKSKGLQKRDEFTSQTMLTLEESNQMRNSIQKIHTFHQEALKHKDEETTEYKNQLESKQAQLNRLTDEKLELIETNASLEKNESKHTSEIATIKTKVDLLNSKYDRLSTIFRKQRTKQFSLLKKINDTGWYANDKLVKELSQFLNSSSTLIDTARIVNNLLSLSSSDEWKTTCYTLMVGKFIKSGNFDQADINFDTLIKPYLEKFEIDLLYSLLSSMQKSTQLADRRRASADLELVKSTITLKQS